MDAGKLPVAGTAGETAAGLPSVRVSVLIPHYDDLENLRICLDLLNRQTLPRESFEVIVADNNSPVGLAAVSAVVAGRARLVTAPEKGAGPARNVAAAHAHASYLAFIDSDCRPAADWLERGLAALAGADIVGGAVNVTVRDATRPSPVEAFEQAFAFQNQR